MTQIINENKTAIGISIEDYSSICNNVMDYINSFDSNDIVAKHNYDLKRDHIIRVVGYTEILTRSLKSTEETLLIAQISALLHDIGRFEQFMQYKTFNDSKSVDHSDLAVKIIEEKGWLDCISEHFQNIIKKSVYFHNKRIIDKTETPEVLFFSNILRDADKLDILEIAIKEYSTLNRFKNPAFSYYLQDSGDVSKEVEICLLAGKLPDKRDLKTVTDFKLLQLSFVYDLNFKESFSIVNKKQYLKQLLDTLPKNDNILEMYRKAKIFVDNQLVKEWAERRF